ncbi:MAG TPA: RidA family protein [Gaiellaceae bacterium]|jgi:enamine deaminase RidA (YjgF/YER057c/UK114 family)
MTVDEKLTELGIELPEPPQLAFTPRLRAVQVHDGVAYLSGNGDFSVCGRVGADVTVEQAAAAARATAFLHCRALVDSLGSLDAVTRWLKVLVLVRSADGFGEQPAVANGYTNAIVELWGEERGLCARSAIGVPELPMGLAVEIEAVVALRES